MATILARALLVSVALGAANAGAAPLNLADTTTREIHVEIEVSSDPATVGTSYGSPIPATYSVAAGSGTVVIADEDYEAWANVDGLAISDVVFRIDLATRAATLVTAIGSVVQPFASFDFIWTLGSERTAGFVEADSFPQLHCESQAQIDALCPIVPQLCAATCVLVPGAAYDPATGKLNMVGFDRQAGCGETGCLTIDLFNRNGDLRLTEASAAAVPASGPLAGPVLAAALLWLAVRRLRALKPGPG